jgi:hypothetical protein
MLYGNRDTNAAWPGLLAGSPVDVARGRVLVGERELRGEDLACLFIRPRRDSDTACVGAVAGSGIVGMRLTARVPYFTSGVGLPDWIVLGPEVCEQGVDGIRSAGFFGVDWSLSAPDSAWGNDPAKP